MASGKFVEKKVRCAVKWHGGKAFLARRILDLIPPHEIYLEPFAGGANVLLNKHRSSREILCDLNAELIHFYQYLVQNTEVLVRMARETPYSKETFLWAKKTPIDPQNPAERALKFLIKCNMSRGGMGFQFSGHGEERRAEKRNLSAWKTCPEDLFFSADRLRGVEIRCQSAFDAIEEFSQNPDVFGYFDPPYYPSTRVSSRVYVHEMSAFEHHQFLAKIKGFSGRAIISGYAHPVYNQQLADWDQHKIPIANSSSPQKVKPRKEEILWVKSFWPF